MKIAVISDTHDHLEILEKVLVDINTRGAEALVHCGDLCSPFVLDRLSKFSGPVHVVFGNNEGDRFTIGRISEKFPNITLHGVVGFLETEHGEVAFTHMPEFARGLASTGRYIAVFYGHTHRRKSELIGDTWLANPGELMGLIEPPGYIIFDLGKGTEEHFTVR